MGFVQFRCLDGQEHRRQDFWFGPRVAKVSMSEVKRLGGRSAGLRGLRTLGGEVGEYSSEWAMEFICRYDCWRLGRYLGVGDGSRGRIESVGGASVLCFNDVGYFNRVYDFGAETVAFLPEILRVYSSCWGREGRYGIELIAQCGFEFGAVDSLLRAEGFGPGEVMVRLGLPLDRDQSYFSRKVRDQGSGVGTSGLVDEFRGVFRQPQREELDAVLGLYLDGFGAPRGNYEAAKRNMMQLFERPDFLTWCAFGADGLEGSYPLALGMLYLNGGGAVLAAGVTREEYRNLGLHEAMIQLRIAHAKALGCCSIYTWTQYGGQSHRNLLACGFEELRVDQVWRKESLGGLC